MSADDAHYRRRIRDLHRSLGLPADYARRGLPLQPEADPAALVAIGRRADGSALQLIAPAARAWEALQAAATADGATLWPLSGFRSVERQAEIVRRHLAAGRSVPSLLAQVAAPGFSEHHTGRALDLGTPGSADLTESFAATPAFSWLQGHAAGFGFRLSYPAATPHGIAFEPWHWCWHGSSVPWPKECAPAAG